MNLRFIVNFARFDGIAYVKRSPMNSLSYVAMPLALLLLIYILSSGKLVEYAVAGGVIALMTTIAMTVTGETAFFKLELKLQDLIVATKADKIDYMIGMGLGNIIFAGPGLVIYGALGLFFGLFTPLNVLVTIVVLLLLVLAATSMAFFIGSFLKNTRSVWAISGILAVIFTMLPPTYYPYTILPQPMLYLLMFSPVTPAAILLQGYYGLGPINNYMFIVLMAEAAVWLYIAKRFTRWGS